MRVEWSRSGQFALGSAIAWWIGSEARGLEDWIAALRCALATAAEFPSLGRPEPKLGPEVSRSIVVGPYRLIYVHEPSSEEITVVDLRHVRRSREGVHLDLLK